MFTASGLQVRFLKIIEKSNYQTVRPRPTHAFVFMINSALTRACLSDQVGEVHHQERRVSVQGLGFCETNAFAKFFVPQEALEVSKRMTEKSYYF